MKTTKYYTAIMIIMATLLAISLRASTSTNNSGINPPVKEDATAIEFELDEEAYIDDIPFDTECISVNCLYQKALLVEFGFDEESYVDDIPFDTEKVAIESEFSLEEESYIDDIPFNTRKIAKQVNSNSNGLAYSRAL